MTEILLGFFMAVNPWTGDHLAELPRGTHLAQVMHQLATPAEFAGIAAEARGRRLQLVVYVHDLAFEDAGHTWRQRGNWLDRSATYEAVLQPYRSVIHSIYVADEPLARGIAPVDLEQVVSWWNGGGWPTMVVEHINRVTDRSRPSCTYYGITPYRYGSGHWVVDWPEYRAKSLEAQADVVVGMGFDAVPYGPTEDQVEASRVHAAWLATMPWVRRPLPLLYFLWPSIPEVHVNGLASSGLFAPPGDPCVEWRRDRPKGCSCLRLPTRRRLP